MRRRAVLIGFALGVAALVGATAFATRAAEPPREVRLVARGMAFLLDGDTAPNPTLHVRAGETVTVVLRNETPGIVHDFSIADLDVAMPPVAPDSIGTVVFHVPEAAGRHQYVCRPHAQMMRGVLVVAD